jgi:hypothetical protein
MKRFFCTKCNKVRRTRKDILSEVEYSSTRLITTSNGKKTSIREGICTRRHV